MPFSFASVWLRTNTRSSAAKATPSIVCKPDSVMFAVVATRQGLLTACPSATEYLRSTIVIYILQKKNSGSEEPLFLRNWPCPTGPRLATPRCAPPRLPCLAYPCRARTDRAMCGGGLAREPC